MHIHATSKQREQRKPDRYTTGKVFCSHFFHLFFFIFFPCFQIKKAPNIPAINSVWDQFTECTRVFRSAKRRSQFARAIFARCGLRSLPARVNIQAAAVLQF